MSPVITNRFIKNLMIFEMIEYALKQSLFLQLFDFSQSELMLGGGVKINQSGYYPLKGRNSRYYILREITI